MRILIVDNNINPESWGAPELRNIAVKVPGATVWVRRAPQEDLPPDPAAFDRIVISGSRTSAMDSAPWVLKLHDFLKKAMSVRAPLLGVCYGHQALVRVMGGLELMRSAERPEVGWTEIELMGESKLLRGLPKKFVTFSSHFQEVSGLPEGVKPLARSRDCCIQAFEVVNAPVFGIQFHPERTLEGAKKTFEIHRKLGNGKILLQPEAGKKLYDPKVAQVIFGNFFSERI